MLFLLSPNISTRKKITYYGAMIVVASIVFYSMSYKSQIDIMKWVILGFVSGLSMITLAAIYTNTTNTYSKTNKYLPYFLVMLIPIFIVVFLYMTSVLLSFENFGEKYLLMNPLVIPINFPLMLALFWILNHEH